MNTELWIDYIALMLVESKEQDRVQYLYPTYDKTLQLSTISLIGPEVKPIACFSIVEQNLGCTVRKWNVLSDKIAKLIKKGELCPEPPKP